MISLIRFGPLFDFINFMNVHNIFHYTVVCSDVKVKFDAQAYREILMSSANTIIRIETGNFPNF